MSRLLLDVLNGHVGGADLLSDATRLPVLHVGAAELIQNLGLASVDVTQHAHYSGT